jgi:hypothetical protein
VNTVDIVLSSRLLIAHERFQKVVDTLRTKPVLADNKTAFWTAHKALADEHDKEFHFFFFFCGAFQNKWMGRTTDKISFPPYAKNWGTRPQYKITLATWENTFMYAGVWQCETPLLPSSEPLVPSQRTERRYTH